MKKFKFDLYKFIKYGSLAAFILCTLVLVVEALLPGKVSSAHSDKFGDIIDIPVDKVIEPKSIKLSEAQGELCRNVYLGQSITLIPNFEPKNATFKQVDWEIEGNATIQDDVITFLSEGTVTVTAISAVNKDISDTFTFDITKAKPQKVNINAPERLLVGKTAVLFASFLPSYATLEYEFKSQSDCIELSGYEIKGLKEGMATIYAVHDGEIVASKDIEIYDIIPQLEFTREGETISSLSASVGEKVEIVIQSPSQDVVPDISYASDIPLIFSAYNRFYISPVKSGHFVVSATVNGHNFDLAVSVSGADLSENVDLVQVSDLNMYVGEYRSPNLIMLSGDKAAYSKPRFSVDGDVVEIDEVGRIYAKKCGEAVVSVSVNGITKSFTVNISIPPLKALKILTPAASPNLKEVYPLVCLPDPIGVDREVRWSSDDEDVASIKDGVVTFRKAGKVNIFAYVDDISTSIELEAFNVLDFKAIKADGIELVNLGDKLYSAVLPLNCSTRLSLLFGKNATFFDYSLRSSDEEVIGVVDNTITALKTGRATVTIKYSDGFSAGETEISLKIEVVKQMLSNTVTNWGKTVRKGLGHFTAFLITGIFASIAFSLIFKRRYVALPVTLAAGFSIAGITELLQMITPNRGPSFADVLLDFEGFCFAAIPILVAFLIAYFVKWYKQRNRKDDK